MKNLTYILLFISLSGFSQILEPVKWTTSLEKISKIEYNIVFTAHLDEGWHLYSQQLPEGGPLPTVFKFVPHDNYKCEGNALEEKGKEVYEDVFEMKVKYFENKTAFKQRIITFNKVPFKLKGHIQYMSCNSEKCIPGRTNFEISIN